MVRNIARRFFFLKYLQDWQKIRSNRFSLATEFDQEADTKKAAGIEKLNIFANEYELQTICELFPALTPEQALMGDDTFYTKHLLSNLEKSSFEKKYMELVRKRNKK